MKVFLFKYLVSLTSKIQKTEICQHVLTGGTSLTKELVVGTISSYNIKKMPKRLYFPLFVVSHNVNIVQQFYANKDGVKTNPGVPLEV